MSSLLAANRLPTVIVSADMLTATATPAPHVAAPDPAILPDPVT